MHQTRQKTEAGAEMAEIIRAGLSSNMHTCILLHHRGPDTVHIILMYVCISTHTYVFVRKSTAAQVVSALMSIIRRHASLCSEKQLFFIPVETTVG